MTPRPAASAIKPARLDVVDISTESDWEDVARSRLNIQDESIKDLVVQELGGSPALRRMFESASEEARRQLIEEFLEQRPELRDRANSVIQAIGGDPDSEIMRIMAEYGGTQAKAAASPRIIDDTLASLIMRDFRLQVSYISGLKVQRLVYGYLVGSGDDSQAKVELFADGWKNHVLALPVETEAALFDLDALSVTRWVNARHGLNLAVEDLYRRLILVRDAPVSADPVYRDVEVLLHTFAHLLIRQSELYTGISRDAFGEFVFPPTLAAAIYTQDGSELGALRTTLSSPILLSWLRATKTSAQECAHDPLCYRGELAESASCHACLHIPERNCNGYWNRSLDRRLVSDLAGGGFLDAIPS